MWLKIRSSMSLEICLQDLIKRKKSLAGFGRHSAWVYLFMLSNWVWVLV